MKVYNDDEADWGEEVLLSPDVMSDSNLKIGFFLKQHISRSFVCQYDTREGCSLKTAPFIILASAHLFFGLFSNITFAEKAAHKFPDGSAYNKDIVVYLT